MAKGKKSKKVEELKPKSKRKGVELELERLHDENGNLTPEAVVNEARDEASLLHPYFEWDDIVAGEAFRLNQARTLIRSFYISYQTETERIECHAYVRDPEMDKNVQGYRHVKYIRADEEAKLQTIESELLRVVSILGRAKEISLTLGLDLGLDHYIQEIGKLSIEIIEHRKVA